MRRLLLLLCLACGLTGCVTEGGLPEATERVHVGDPLPPLELTMADGTEVSNQTLSGKTTVLCFFSTTCADCQKFLPVLQAFYEHITTDKEEQTLGSEGKQNPGSEDIYVIAVSRGEGRASVEAYWCQHGLTLPYSPQNDRRIYELFATAGIPRLYIIDTSGHVTHAYSDQALPTLAMLLNAVGIE